MLYEVITNVGRMSIGLPCYVSATPNGIIELLKRYQIETSGKKCVVLGRRITSYNVCYTKLLRIILQ